MTPWRLGFQGAFYPLARKPCVSSKTYKGSDPLDHPLEALATR
jgi:hypothetical protein